MARVLTTGEKATLRKTGQWGKYYLAIPEYHVKYSAILATVPTSTDMVYQLEFESGEGDINGVLVDMALYIGSTEGGRELGMCRIRKATTIDSLESGIFYIGLESNVDWSAVSPIYLTVMDDYQLWVKPSVTVSGVVKADYDVAYTNQHTVFDPVPMMGCHRVAKLSAATIDVVLGASADTDAWVIGSTIASKLWTVEGGTFDDATVKNPTATFSAVGTYLVYCQFTTVLGTTFTGVRYVIIWDDAHPLITNFVVNNGEYSQGCSFDVTVLSGMDKASIRERSLVILCSDDYAENLPVTIPHQIENATNIKAIGWISDINSTQDSEKGAITFTVQSAQYWMSQLSDFAAPLKQKAGTSSKWTDIASLTVQKAIWHNLHWRSTVTRVMDVYIIGDTRLNNKYDNAKGNLWGRISDIGQKIFAVPIVDLYGRLFVEIEPQMLAVSDRTGIPVVMALTKQDIEGGIDWTRRDVKALSMLHFSGIKVGATNGASTFFSVSPGVEFEQTGAENQLDKYLVALQAQGNSMCGCYFGWQNGSPYDITLEFSNSMQIIGVAPRQYFSIVISAADDPRGIGYTGNLVPRSCSFSIDKNGFTKISAQMEIESVPGLGIKEVIPNLNRDFSTPDIEIPPILPIPPYINLDPTEEPNNHPKKVLVISNHGVSYTENFDDDTADIEYVDMNNGLQDNDISTIVNYVMTPAGSLYLFSVFNRVYYCQGLGCSWVEIASATDFPYGVMSIGVNPTSNDSVIICGLGTFPATIKGNVIVASYGTVAKVDNQIPLRYTYGATVWTAGKWCTYGCHYGFFVGPHMVRLSSGGSAEYDGTIGTAVGQDAARRYAQAIDVSDKVYQWDGSAAGGFNVITDGGATVARSTAFTPSSNQQGMAFSPTGTHAMGSTGLGFTPYRTVDSGGFSWQSVGGTIPSGSDVWENCKDDYRWIFGGGTNLKLTMDRGDTAIEKIGNLYSMHPLLDISHIRFIE